MTNYTKSQIVVPLMLVARAGITVRGFEKLEQTRGGGAYIKAKYMTASDGVAVSGLSVDFGMRDGAPIVVSWTAAGQQHRRVFQLLVSDGGDVKIEPWAEPEPVTAEQPTWR